ncbi:hypothetical protein AB0M95_22150 [Sphaerisporangium sp. NPDC051017]|uniref:hypothetical protein n=1 Tax=Sphaerisporangium sp. NPDC051017 TaxID=3154636 RepID=UPI003438D4CA
MSHPNDTMVNVAEGSATVGIQTEAVHGDVNVYQLSPDPSPQERFELGVSYLHGGMPGKAREYIGEAVLNGYVTTRSCFYLLLAMLSGRTLQQVSKEELYALRYVEGSIARQPEDEWTGAIRMIVWLLAALRAGPVDSSVIDGEIRKLGAHQQDEILQHLEMFLSGPIQDGLWARAFDLAKSDRCDRRRLDRVWRFFQPEPIGARVRPPRPIQTTNGDWGRTIATTAVSLASAGLVGAQSWRYDWPSTALALLMFAIGSYACARNGVNWRFWVERRRAKDREHLARGQRTPAPQGGFAAAIDRQFDHYFARYVPPGVDRGQWLAYTAGIRESLRDEVVYLYRESRTEAKRVAWLTRYLVSDVRRRWQAGTLWEYRDRLRVPLSTKMLFALGAAAVVASAGVVMDAASRAESGTTLVPVVIALVSGWAAVRGWLRVVLERKRYDAEETEARTLLDERRAAFARWKAKLADKPSDIEMAHWLDCDRKAFLEEAMRHYKLTPRDVVAHGFIEAPAAPYDRARVRNGPWRYSRYRLVVFLLTADGVRQVTAELDFGKAELHFRGRINYRYDAVAAVQVTQADDGRRTFELTLVNGPAIRIDVTGPPLPMDTWEPDSGTVSQVTLDSAGLENTLHVIEGVAAEGKRWIDYERRRERERLADLTDAVGGLFGRPPMG